MDCVAAPWDGSDWLPCFRAMVLDTALPVLVLAVCTFMLFAWLHRRRHKPRAPPAAPRHTPTERVLEAETAVILEEANSLARDDQAYRDSLRAPSYLRTDMVVCACLALGQILLFRHTNKIWHIYTLYAFLLCVYAWYTRQSLFFYKLGLVVPYAIVTCFHLRSLWLQGTLHSEWYQALGILVALLSLLLRRRLDTIPAKMAFLATNDESERGTVRISEALPPSEAYASLLGRITYLFITPFLWRQYFAPTTFDAIPQLPLKYRAAVIVSHVRLNANKMHTSLLYRLWLALGSTTTRQITLSFFRACFRIVPIACLSQLLDFASRRDDAKARGEEPPPLHIGLFWTGALFSAQLIEFLLEMNVYHAGRTQSIELRSFLSTELFSKILRRDVLGAKAPESSARMSDGHIASLLAVDMFKIDSFMAFVHQPVVEYPLTILFCSLYLFHLLGPSALVGLSVLIVTAPLQTQLSKFMVRVQDSILQATDARLDLVNEVFLCIKTVKFFAWEKPFLDRLYASRAKELVMLARNNLISVTYNFIFVGMPMMVTIATFGTYTYVFGHPLTAKTAFTALSIFTSLRLPLSDLPEMIVLMLGAIVSVRRIDAFLKTQDTSKYEQLQATNEDVHPATSYLGFHNATFAYNPQDPHSFRLSRLNCRFPIGKLSVVLGPVGSGKTCLLLSLMGEVHRLEGTTFTPCPANRSMLRSHPQMNLTESVAYCTQNAWLLGTTVRENILFGTEYNEERYREVLYACALEPDLDILEHHDETEVGEKGTSLSGGQKARIALARSFYSYARHILIDDALSAVDAQTAEHLYHHCFHGPLGKDRTIVLVTHSVSLVLPTAVYAVVMDNGRISAEGKPMDLIQTGRINSTLQDPVPVAPFFQAENSASSEQEAKWKAANKRRARKNKFANAESIDRKARGMELYVLYMKSAAQRTSIAVGLWLLLLCMYVIVRTSDIMSNAWLKKWASTYETDVSAFDYLVQMLHIFHEEPAPGMDRTKYYLFHYILLVFLFILVSTLRDLLQYYISLRASRLLYSRVLHGLLYACPRFFDVTPIGRIMNRLSKDVETVDQDMAPSLRMMIEAVVTLAAILGIICWATPSFLYMAGFVLILYYVIASLYLGSSRELKRIESVERSPLFTLLGETLAGTITIRAFGDSERVIRRCLHVVDRTHRAFLYLWYENRWLSMCVDFMGAIVTCITATLLVTTGADAALTGFTLAYAVLIVQTVLRIVRRYTTTEINLNSVERLQEYLDVPSESQGGEEPPAHWPSSTGMIHVRDLSVRYGPEHPLALSRVTFDIQPGHKIGIVGRTGSGKSTLSLAFFRFLEAENGSITIDGIDISHITLESLRRRLTIIPQDSQLFRGTIRSNLDPFGVCDDGDMWFALQRCQLAATGSSPRVPGAGSVVKSLDDPVEQGGSNFSAGQRQLLSLARGMLKMRESRILILDESTANLDAESDALIQRTIREQMAPGATILTVAHRLKTIIDYDKVLVLGKGRVLEYDSPSRLLANPDSTFHMLCERTGDLAQLKAAADQALATSTL